MTRIKLNDIVFDGGTQIRAAINEDVVSEYAEQMTEGAQFPAVVIFHDGSRYYMADGFHRGLASKRAGFVDIFADVKPGTKTDALWYALGANKANGQRLTAVDKKHAIELALRVWPDKSMKQIAEQSGCSYSYVQRLKDVHHTTSGNVQARVTGSDGKSYPANRHVRAERDAEVARLVSEGKSSEEIRASVGRVSGHVIAKARREAEAPVLPNREHKFKSRAAVQQRRQDVRDMAERGFSTRQIASAIGIGEGAVSDIAKKEGIVIHADRLVGKTKRLNANRIMDRIVADAENVTAGVDLITFADLDREQIAGWLKSLTASRDKLGAFIRRLMKEKQQHGEAA